MASKNGTHRIGILTGGGDCPGLNAVIRAAVKTAICTYGYEVLGIEDGFEGLLAPDKVRSGKPQFHVGGAVGSGGGGSLDPPVLMRPLGPVLRPATTKSSMIRGRSPTARTVTPGRGVCGIMPSRSRSSGSRGLSWWQR
ncbi:MAG: 6-phosphofructokinase [Candidatus Riflebacteria bacterium]|nr:6-phosphofructokinase [Candidatus Riflebacteria bacterium]